MELKHIQNLAMYFVNIIWLMIQLLKSNTIFRIGLIKLIKWRMTPYFQNISTYNKMNNRAFTSIWMFTIFSKPKLKKTSSCISLPII